MERFEITVSYQNGEETTLRAEVASFVALGPLPNESSDDQEFAKFEQALDRIMPPLSDEEAHALLGSFGEDECYGMAWDLVHLIETSPTPFPERQPISGDNVWLQILYQRYLSSLCQSTE